MTLRKYFSHPSLVIYCFATPPIKLKLGLQIGGGLLITNHLDQSLWCANQKHWAVVRSYLLHSFLQMHSAGEPFTSPCNVRNYAELKLFSWVKSAYVGFSSSIFCVGSHTEHRWRCSKLLNILYRCAWRLPVSHPRCMLECIQCIGLALKAWPNRITQLPTTPSGWEVSHNGESWTCEPSWVINIDGSDWLHPISTLSFLYIPRFFADLRVFDLLVYFEVNWSHIQNGSSSIITVQYANGCSYNIYPHNLETWMNDFYFYKGENNCLFF